MDINVNPLQGANVGPSQKAIGAEKDGRPRKEEFHIAPTHPTYASRTCVKSRGRQVVFFLPGSFDGSPLKSAYIASHVMRSQRRTPLYDKTESRRFSPDRGISHAKYTIFARYKLD